MFNEVRSSSWFTLSSKISKTHPPCLQLEVTHSMSKLTLGQTSAKASAFLFFPTISIPHLHQTHSTFCFDHILKEAHQESSLGKCHCTEGRAVSLRSAPAPGVRVPVRNREFRLHANIDSVWILLLLNLENVQLGISYPCIFPTF